jgi:hypothetical protein
MAEENFDFLCKLPQAAENLVRELAGQLAQQLCRVIGGHALYQLPRNGGLEPAEQIHTRRELQQREHVGADLVGADEIEDGPAIRVRQPVENLRDVGWMALLEQTPGVSPRASAHEPE